MAKPKAIPPIPPQLPVRLRLTPEEHERLRTEAFHRRLSMARLAWEFVVEGIERAEKNREKKSENPRHAT